MQRNFQLEVETDQYIRGFIHADAEGSKRPCVIFSHGFMGDMVEPHFMFVKIARALEKLGIVAIRFDFMGSGESDGEFSKMTFSEEVKQCEQVIEYARQLDFVDEDRVSLLGYSMGGAVSICAAANHPDNIKNLILISPAANMQDVMTRDIRGERIRTLLESKVVDFEGNLLSREAIDDIFDLDLYAEVSKVVNPVCLIHGTEDESVPPFVSIRIKELLGEKCEMTFIHGADHHYASREFEHKLINNIMKYSRSNIL